MIREGDLEKTARQQAVCRANNHEGHSQERYNLNPRTGMVTVRCNGCNYIYLDGATISERRRYEESAVQIPTTLLGAVAA